MLKAARGGYDGKGVWPVGDRAEAAAVLAQVAGRVVVEELLPLDAELAVMVARSPSGASAAWPAVETAQVGGVCREVLVPGRLDADVVEAASALGQKVAEIAGGVGVMAVELFWSGGRLLVNEVATRPHNSGHWTMEGAVTSQFENHVRAVLDLPLGSTAPQHPQVASVNIFGGADGHRSRAGPRPRPRRGGSPRAPLRQARPARTQTGPRDGVRRRARGGARPGLVGGRRPRDTGARRHRPAGGGPAVTSPAPLVAVVMGSSSDLPVMQGAVDMLERFGVAHEVRVVSAHRTPRDMLAFGSEAAGRGLRVLIAGAGGAAHLPGMLASVTTLPVIGVPVALSQLDGLDSLLSIVQMPKGVPVATMAVNGARNAGPAGGAHPGPGRPGPHRRMAAFQEEIAADARAQDAAVSDGGAARDG